jgi:probable phosphoglycerate mutase
MGTRRLYLARHGAADPFGTLTDIGRQQSNLLGKRLAGLPVNAIWHSPLPRAAASAHEMARHLPDVPVLEAAELIDHIPYVPSVAERPPSWAGFFDGFGAAEAASGHSLAEALTARFAGVPGPALDTHEVLITHAYPIAWLVRDALDAPPSRWRGLNSANTALTVIEYRTASPPTIVTFNDQSHLPADLRWTGFPSAARP